VLTESLDPVVWNARIDAWGSALANQLAAEERHAWDRAAAELKAALADRRRALEAQLAHPGPAVPVFHDGVAGLAGWEPLDVPVSGEAAHASSPEGVNALRIHAGPGSGAAWRTRVELAPGDYRFEGRLRVSGVVPRAGSRQPGAGLRVAGRSRTTAGLTGEAAWTSMTADFTVAAPGETVDLRCELNAEEGLLWVDIESLRLRRRTPSALTLADAEASR